MDDDAVFEAVAQLVAAGEYLDTIPGKSNVDIEGGGMFTHGPDGGLQRMYHRGSSRFLEARARGWIDPLPPLHPAPLAAVEEAEELAGLPLPPLLRRLYLEVGNGGFGPGYGLLGLRGGHSTGGQTALAGLGRGSATVEPDGPKVPMLLCDWGCAITTEVDLADGQIWGSDPNPAPDGVSCTFPQGLTVREWFAKWLDNRLYQPWLVEDPATGVWRGATDEEYAESVAEFDDVDDW